jgi:hypothetical protein
VFTALLDPENTNKDVFADSAYRSEAFTGRVETSRFSRKITSERVPP